MEVTCINGQFNHYEGEIADGFGVITVGFGHDGYGIFGNDEFKLGSSYKSTWDEGGRNC